MTTPLMYGTKEMLAEPLNMSLSAVAMYLLDREPVVVSLEPGDATNYTLLIVPALASGVHGQLGRYGIPLAACRDYLFISKLSGEACPGTFVRPPCHDFDFEFISPNEWTRTFLAWWVNELWTRIKL